MKTNFKIGNKKYKIVWCHITGEEILPRPELRGLSICQIRNADDEPLSEGVARCVSSDSFCYRIGRRLSLQRALSALFSNKQTRRTAWHQVLEFKDVSGK